jgi:hypothetical protein
MSRKSWGYGGTGRNATAHGSAAPNPTCDTLKFLGLGQGDRTDVSHAEPDRPPSLSAGFRGTVQIHIDEPEALTSVAARQGFLWVPEAVSPGGGAQFRQLASPTYGSEGEGFESLRARKAKRRLSCGNVDQPPLVVRPLWTWSVPKVIRCFGSVQTGTCWTASIRATWSSILGGDRGDEPAVTGYRRRLTSSGFGEPDS